MQTLISRKSQMSGFAYTIEVVGICMVIVTIFAALEVTVPERICNGLSHIVSAGSTTLVGTKVFTVTAEAAAPPPPVGLVCK